MEIANLISKQMAMARSLFDEIRWRTADGPGVTRAAYGEGEQVAWDCLAQVASAAKLEISTDPAANLYMTLPGADRDGPVTIVGSHLDSVRQGGNYDGLAGVIAGLVVAIALREAGVALNRDLVVLGLRGEENAWFAGQHIGSRAALGLLDPAVLVGTRRIDTGQTLAEHMRAAGAAPDSLRSRTAFLSAANVSRYIELHIEQGPVLAHADLPVGVVTAIRGNVRCAQLKCIGEYGHSGALPRSLRHDAVLAMADLMSRMEARWNAVEAAGGDLLVTFGTIASDPAAHGITTVPGEVSVSFDARSHTQESLDSVVSVLHEVIGQVGASRGVSFEMGKLTGARPSPMDADVEGAIVASCRALGIPFMELPSGPGHDAADFAEAGIPTGMIFVRNFHGSHNPREHMEIDDFSMATQVLAEAILRLA